MLDGRDYLIMFPACCLFSEGIETKFRNFPKTSFIFCFSLAMEINGRSDLLLLEPLLKVDFTNASFKLHSVRYNHFCIDCNEISFCQQCKVIKLYEDTKLSA